MYTLCIHVMYYKYYNVFCVCGWLWDNQADYENGIFSFSNGPRKFRGGYKIAVCIFLYIFYESGAVCGCSAFWGAELQWQAHRTLRDFVVIFNTVLSLEHCTTMFYEKNMFVILADMLYGFLYCILYGIYSYNAICSIYNAFLRALLFHASFFPFLFVFHFARVYRMRVGYTFDR